MHVVLTFSVHFVMVANKLLLEAGIWNALFAKGMVVFPNQSMKTLQKWQNAKYAMVQARYLV